MCCCERLKEIQNLASKRRRKKRSSIAASVSVECKRSETKRNEIREKKEENKLKFISVLVSLVQSAKFIQAHSLLNLDHIEQASAQASLAS